MSGGQTKFPLKAPADNDCQERGFHILGKIIARHLLKENHSTTSNHPDSDAAEGKSRSI